MLECAMYLKKNALFFFISIFTNTNIKKMKKKMFFFPSLKCIDYRNAIFNIKILRNMWKCGDEQPTFDIALVPHQLPSQLQQWRWCAVVCAVPHQTPLSPWAIKPSQWMGLMERRREGRGCLTAQPCSPASDESMLSIDYRSQNQSEINDGVLFFIGNPNLLGAVISRLISTNLKPVTTPPSPKFHVKIVDPLAQPSPLASPLR